MFKLKTERGDHKIFEYDTTKFKFKEFIEDLYDSNELNELHQKSFDFNNIVNNTNNTEKNINLNDIETDLHKKFYNEIKTNNKFKNLYCLLIQDIFTSFFPDEKLLIYQSYPSIRFQFENSVAVPPHCDSDDIGKHPLGEKNFIIPITTMSNTNSLYIESKPNKGDFESVYLEYGDIFYFNGNKCIHKNVPNKEGKL
jgi:arsenate reductase-like glutaredoxin family protein